MTFQDFHPMAALLVGRKRETRRCELLRCICRLLCGRGALQARQDTEGSPCSAAHARSDRAAPLLRGTANSISQPDKTNCEIYLSQAGLSST